MDFMAIIQLVMTILTIIMEFLGGGHFDRVLVPDQQVAYHLASYQWSCSKPAWAEAGAVSNGVFSGTLEMKCEVEGTNGGGLISLRNHMLDQLNRTSSQIHQGPIVKNFEGLPSHAYDHSMVIEGSDRNEYEMRGETNLATNGFTVLRNVYRATEIPQNGDLHYLKGMEDAIEVASANQAGHWQVTLRSKSQVAKPWYVSSDTFKQAVQQKLEEKMENRRERIMNDLASQL